MIKYLIVACECALQGLLKNLKLIQEKKIYLNYDFKENKLKEKWKGKHQI